MGVKNRTFYIGGNCSGTENVKVYDLTKWATRTPLREVNKHGKRGGNSCASEE